MCVTGRILLPKNISEIFSGDNINLIVEIETQEKIFMKEIFLNFYGEVNVKWEDLINKPKDGKIIYIMQKFEDQKIIVNNRINIQTMDVLIRGKHIYNVLLNIPPRLPESSERKYGSIRYELELDVHHATGVKILCKMPINIKEYVNIWLKEEYKMPFKTVFEKSFFCCPPLKLTLLLPTTTFIPGDSIKYSMIIKNFNKILDLKRLSAILTQTQYYTALKPKKRTKQVHTTHKLMIHHFNRNHHNSKFQGSLKLSECLQPTTQESNPIMISYKLQFILVFKGFHSDGYISLPVIVGSHRDIREKIGDFKKYETRLEIEQNHKNEYEV